MQIRCRCSWLLGLVSNRKQHWRQHTSDRLTCQRRAKLPWGLKRMKETQFQRTGSETWRAQSCAKPLDSTQGTNSHTSTQTICTITHTHTYWPTASTLPPHTGRQLELSHKHMEYHVASSPLCCWAGGSHRCPLSYAALFSTAGDYHPLNIFKNQPQYEILALQGNVMLRLQCT